MYRLASTAPRQLISVEIRLEGAYFGSTSVTDGRLLAKTDPPVPSAHCDGTESGNCAYRSQRGVGVASPTHVSCCTALGRPVLLATRVTSDADGACWNTATPPPMRARGPRRSPSMNEICCASPSVFEKLM